MVKEIAVLPCMDTSELAYLFDSLEKNGYATRTLILAIGRRVLTTGVVSFLLVYSFKLVLFQLCHNYILNEKEVVE
jgi:hypothetical protein